MSHSADRQKVKSFTHILLLNNFQVKYNICSNCSWYRVPNDVLPFPSQIASFLPPLPLSQCFGIVEFLGSYYLCLFNHKTILFAYKTSIYYKSKSPAKFSSLCSITHITWFYFPFLRTFIVSILCVCVDLWMFTYQTKCGFRIFRICPLISLSLSLWFFLHFSHSFTITISCNYFDQPTRHDDYGIIIR